MRINVLPDGNCGFNAIAVRLCDLGLTEELPRLVNRDAFFPLISELFDKNPQLKRPEDPEQYFPSFLEQIPSWVDRQLLLAPLLREHSLHIHQFKRQEILSHLQGALLIEYDEFLNNRRPENLRFFHFIEEFFQRTLRDFPDVEDVEKAKGQLESWWQQEGFDLYLASIAENGQWVDNDTLRLLAEELGFGVISILRAEQRDSSFSLDPQEMAIDWEGYHWYAHISSQMNLKGYEQERLRFIQQRDAAPFSPRRITHRDPEIAASRIPPEIHEKREQVPVVASPHSPELPGHAQPANPEQLPLSEPIIPFIPVTPEASPLPSPMLIAPALTQRPVLSPNFVRPASPPPSPEHPSWSRSSALFFPHVPQKIEQLVHTAKQNLQSKNPYLIMEEIERISENYKTLVKETIEKFSESDTTPRQTPRTQEERDRILAENLQREEVEAFLRSIHKP